MSREELARAAAEALIPIMVASATPREAAEAVLAITEAANARAVMASRREVIGEVLHWSDTVAGGDLTVGELLDGLDGLLRRLAAEAGITIDATTEEA